MPVKKHSGQHPVPVVVYFLQKMQGAYSDLHLHHVWSSILCWDALSSKQDVSQAATFNPGSKKSDLSELTDAWFYSFINFPLYLEHNP